MPVLNPDQTAAFDADGYLMLPDAVTAGQLAALRAQFADWVAESRDHDAPYGETVDGRPRFDVEPGHSAGAPALRRVASPADLSEAYWEVVANSAMTEAVAQVIVPDLRFHHSKTTSKLPGAATKVDWHQAFMFEPPTNLDLVTAL